MRKELGGKKHKVCAVEVLNTQHPLYCIVCCNQPHMPNLYLARYNRQYSTLEFKVVLNVGSNLVCCYHILF